jgi:hypothetical protein
MALYTREMWMRIPDELFAAITAASQERQLSRIDLIIEWLTKAAALKGWEKAEVEANEKVRELRNANGGSWGSAPGWPVDDWKYEVANGDTVLGYWEWAFHHESDPEAGKGE